MSKENVIAHLNKMLECAKKAEADGSLQDSGRTVESLEKATEAIKNSKDFEMFFSKFISCSKFPCKCVSITLLHNNTQIRSDFYYRGIVLCTNLKQRIHTNIYCQGIDVHPDIDKNPKKEQLYKLLML